MVRTSTDGTQLVTIAQEAIDDVGAAVDSRRDGGIAYAVKMAGQFARLGKVTAELIKGCSDLVPTGRWLVVHTRLLRRLMAATPAMERAFREFVKEHRPVMDDRSIEQIEAFLVWGPERLRVLRAAVQAERAEFEKDLGTDGRLDEVVDRFAPTLKDRLDD